MIGWICLGKFTSPESEMAEMLLAPAARAGMVWRDSDRNRSIGGGKPHVFA